MDECKVVLWTIYGKLANVSVGENILLYLFLNHIIFKYSNICICLYI